MNILAIETSGKTFSIALAKDTTLIAEIFMNDGLTHSEKLIPSLDWIMKEVGWKLIDLNKIAVSVGPGSFTGIRIGLCCARMLAQNLKIPLVGITTLDILSSGIPENNYLIYPAIDALRNEIFVKNKKNEVEIKPVESIGNEFKKTKSKILMVGNACINYKLDIQRILKKKVIFPPDNLNFPRAGVLAVMSCNKKGENYKKVLPLYVRRSWAEEHKASSEFRVV